MSYADIAEMLKAGIRGAVTCAYVQGAAYSGTVLDHFRLLLEQYVPLCESRGFELYVALGIHPRGIPSDWFRVADQLQDWLLKPNVVALGEVGLETGDTRECEVLRCQLELAAAVGKPVVVHLPGNNREEICRKVLSISEKAQLAPSSLLIDHVGPDVVETAATAGCRLGFTVKPGRLSPGDVFHLVAEREYCRKAVLNSDAANLKPNDPLAVAKTGAHLREMGIDEDIVRALTG